ncbi:MAG TPA: PEP-CTERM sorting domain-containing protein [Rhizomicrobium sp.]|jgi:hypothetical protein|nr:PEP-CTERM sorting domain-containing protein [Rhizomicrobium sp.]
MNIRRSMLLGLTLAAFVPCAPALADTVTVTYYNIAENDQDANHLATGIFDNEVQTALGANGLPVLNTTAFGCSSMCYATGGAPTDVLGDGEITYWSPALNNGGAGGTSDVTQTGTAVVPLPFNVPSNFFPPNGTGSSDNNGFMAATLSATLIAGSTEQISFNIGADDMAFAYLDGQVVCDLGGVHADTAGTCVTPFDITAGDHSLEVFFVDINNVQSGLTFGINTTDVTTGNPVPEPFTLSLFGVGLAGAAAMRRRKKA